MSGFYSITTVYSLRQSLSLLRIILLSSSQALEPDAQFLGQPCDYGNGFGCTLVAFIFSFFQSVMLWLWVSGEAVQKYEFGSKAGYEPSSGEYRS